MDTGDDYDIYEENLNDDGIEIRNNSIIINNVNRKHIGGYQCWAINTMGKTFSEIVQLDVKCKCLLFCVVR